MLTLHRFDFELQPTIRWYSVQTARQGSFPAARNSLIAGEEATRVLASAGSGKTSVIVARAARLIGRRIWKPE
jgi:hypothetical protein